MIWQSLAPVGPIYYWQVRQIKSAQVDFGLALKCSYSYLLIYLLNHRNTLNIVAR